MHKLIETTFKGLFKGYNQGALAENKAQINEAECLKMLSDIIEIQQFKLQIESFDRWIAKQSVLKEIEPLLFDVLMLNHFIAQSDEVDESYFSSAEWLEIEEISDSRGSELITMINYLQECKDEDIEPDLSDFLSEYLMTDEDGFQDDAEVYESMIAHQILMESDMNEIARVASNLSADDPIQKEFYPFMAWFYNQSPDAQSLTKILQAGPHKTYSGACLFAIIAFYNSN